MNNSRYTLGVVFCPFAVGSPSKVSQINKASVRASESIQAMRNNAWFAKPASKPDTSPFKLPEEALLGGG